MFNFVAQLAGWVVGGVLGAYVMAPWSRGVDEALRAEKVAQERRAKTRWEALNKLARKAGLRVAGGD